jgi:hypothetical protein
MDAMLLLHQQTDVRVHRNKDLRMFAPVAQFEPNLRYPLRLSGGRMPSYLDIISQLQTMADAQETMGNDFQTRFG